MKDKDFYGSGKHSEAGSEMIYLDGAWYEKHSIDYMKSQSPLRSKQPKSLDIIKSDTVNYTGFSKGKKTTDILPEDHDPVEAKRQRLVLLQQQEARLEKQLDGLRKVIKIVRESI